MDSVEGETASGSVAAAVDETTPHCLSRRQSGDVFPAWSGVLAPPWNHIGTDEHVRFSWGGGERAGFLSAHQQS